MEGTQLADKPRDFENLPFGRLLCLEFAHRHLMIPLPFHFLALVSFLARPKSVFLCSATQASCCAKVRAGAKK